MRPVQTDNLVLLPTVDVDVREVADTFSALVSQGDVAKTLIIYEDPDGALSWSCSTFEDSNAQIGFVYRALHEMTQLVTTDSGV